jgi:hypothetical protein
MAEEFQVVTAVGLRPIEVGRELAQAGLVAEARQGALEGGKGPFEVAMDVDATR